MRLELNFEDLNSTGLNVQLLVMVIKRGYSPLLQQYITHNQYICLHYICKYIILIFALQTFTTYILDKVTNFFNLGTNISQTNTTLIASKRFLKGTAPNNYRPVMGL